VPEREIEDRLREEYFSLLPNLNRIADHLKTTIQYILLPLSRDLKPYESLIAKARVKECNSAIDKLEQFNPATNERSPGAVFDRDHPEIYSLLTLRDLVAVRVLAFPSSIASAAASLLHQALPDWKPDPINVGGRRIASKYNGEYTDGGRAFQCEFQVVSTLIGLFWEVEHAAIYKQAPNLKGLEPLMREHTSDVYAALTAFEDEFERQLLRSESESTS
jgi:hypothetical protein